MATAKVTEMDREIAVALASEEGHEETVSAKDCILDLSYAREPKRQRWQQWVDAWNPALFGRPYLSRRSNGDLAILDGGHRIAALRARRGEEAEFKAIILDGLAVEDEAWLFVHMDTDRTSPSPAEIFRGQLIAKEQEALDILLVCSSEHVDILGVDRAVPSGSQGRTGARISSTLAIGTLRRLYHAGGSRLLRSTLSILKQTWGDDHGAFDRFPLLSVSGFISLWPHADDDRLMAVMSKHRPGDLHRSAQMLAETFSIGSGGESLTAYGRRILAEWYNQGLRVKAKRLNLGGGG
jgi:hypothetical protein